MDYFTKCFCESVVLAAKTQGNGISIKFSPLVNYSTLKKANTVQKLFVEFFDETCNGDPEVNEASLEDVRFNKMKFINYLTQSAFQRHEKKYSFYGEADFSRIYKRNLQKRC